jgi:hypothetical protein
MAARGPDFRSRYLDVLPASNADTWMTIAELLGPRIEPERAPSGQSAYRGAAGA